MIKCLRYFNIGFRESLRIYIEKKSYFPEMFNFTCSVDSSGSFNLTQWVGGTTSKQFTVLQNIKRNNSKYIYIIYDGWWYIDYRTELNLRINSFLIFIVVCKRQFRGESVHGMGQFDQRISFLLVVDNFPWEIWDWDISTVLTQVWPHLQRSRLRRPQDKTRQCTPAWEVCPERCPALTGRAGWWGRL